MMNYRTLRLLNRPAAWAALALLAMIGTPGEADIVTSIDEGRLGGSVSLTHEADALTLTDADGNQRSIKLRDIEQVRFNLELTEANSEQELLINADKGTGTHQGSASVKLRAGLHRITIPYWQADGEHQLAVYASGPGINGRAELNVDHLRCFRDNNDDAQPSAGKDEQGYRLPDLALKEADNRRRMLTRARYRLYVGDEQIPLNGVKDLANLQLKRSGTTSTINTGMLNANNRNIGLVFDGFFKANLDGEYHFTLLSNDGSQLYLGQIDQFETGQLGIPPVNTPWRVELAHDGTALGELKSIADQTMTFHVPLVSDITLSLSHVRALWDNRLDLSTINRDNEPGNQDTVYIRDRNDPDSLRSVSGRIEAFDDTSLSFVFRGQTRTITRDRVAGMVFRDNSRPAPPAPGFHQSLQLLGGQQLPGKILSIDEEHISFQLIGGGKANPPRDVVRSMHNVNGRHIDLTRTTPIAEEAIPYFGLKLPHKVNTNFAGKPIVLFNEKTYERGLAVHSKSRLHYRLEPGCERFQATFGLMAPGGKLGNVTARVLGDGQVLWQQDNITATTPPIQVDVPLQGVQRLVLEVDFGQGEDVGDRAAWCNPRLIYATQD